MSRKPISGLLGIDGVRARLREARLLLEAGGVALVLRVLDRRAPLLGGGGLPLGGAVGVRLGLLARGLRLRVELGLATVALGRGLAVLGGDLVLEPRPLLLVLGALGAHARLFLGLLGLGALLGFTRLGVGGGLLEASFAREIVVAER